MKSSYIELPLFPLRTVLFPGMPLPLHIFEERYRLMIQECMESNPTFGVVLEKGDKPFGESDTYRVGTSAIITSVTDLEQEQFDIVTVGYQRFKIHSLLYDRPFLKGLVEIMPPRDEDTNISHIRAESLLRHLDQYVQLLAELSETKLDLGNLPKKPVLIAFLTAILLQVPLTEKQNLLAMETIPDMLVLEKKILTREMQLLRADIGAEYSIDGVKNPFSNN